MGKILVTVLAVTTAWSGAAAAMDKPAFPEQGTDNSRTRDVLMHDIETLEKMDRRESRFTDPALERAYRMMDAIQLPAGCRTQYLPGHRRLQPAP